MKKSDTWSKFVLEFVSVFIAVVFAFGLNNWNDNRKDQNAEKKVLREIVNGLTQDLKDIDVNVRGHKEGIAACSFWRKVIRNADFNQDSIMPYYIGLTRDYVSIQNTAGYETLKSKGLELIKNDSLRLEIISLYEYDFKTMEKLEEEYSEMQFQRSYFKELNRMISPFFGFDEKGIIQEIKTPISLSKSDEQIFLTYLFKIEGNRQFILGYYSALEEGTLRLIGNIIKELEE